MLRHLATGILSALHYLHENNVVHKDIRDSSVHIDRSGIVKLSDYSLDKRLSDVYQASCLEKTEDDFPTIQGRSGKKLDIYRFGILLLSLLKGSIVSEKKLELDSIIQVGQHSILIIIVCVQKLIQLLISFEITFNYYGLNYFYRFV